MMMTSDASHEQAARLFAGAHQAMPVVLREDTTAPRIEGDPGHWTTASGAPVYHPSAYSKKGRCYYHCTTQKVVAGTRWLNQHPLRQQPDGYAVIGGRQWVHGIRIDRILWYDGQRQYKVSRDTRHYHTPNPSPRGAVKEALQAWRAQNANLNNFLAGLTHQIDQILVTEEDSVRAGNCRYGTRRFILKHHLGKSIRADRLLDLDPSHHVRAAIAAADL